MFETLRLKWLLRRAIDLGNELSQFGPTFRNLVKRDRLQEKIHALQVKTETVTLWHAQLKIWFPQVITYPSWRQAKIERRTFKTLTRV